MAADRTLDPVDDLLRRSRIDRGLPATVTDADALARVVAVLRAADRRGGDRP